MSRRGAGPGIMSLVAVALVAAAASCGSGHTRSAVATGASSTTPPPTVGAQASTTATTVAHQLPTVPNCGGGAFEPKTLLIVCGTGTTMATGVSWRSWGSTAATGSGTVQLRVSGGQTASDAASLALSEVRNGPVGPQFTLLTVTWTGISPDGRHQDTYPLQMQG